jgi:broad specificity phosphatase PhoE
VARHPDQTVAVICHGGVQKAVFWHAFDLAATATRLVKFWPLHTSITHWRYHPADGRVAPYWTLLTFNDASHLLPHGAVVALPEIPSRPTLGR